MVFLRAKNFPWKLFIIFLFTTIGIGVTGYSYFQLQTEQVKEQKQRELAAIGNLKVDQIANWRAERFNDAMLLMGDRPAARTLQSWLVTPNASDLRFDLLAWLDPFLANSTYASVFILDLKGNPLLALPESTSPVFVSPDLAALVVSERKPKLSDFYRNTQAVDLNLIVPILDPQHADAAPIALVLLMIDSRQFLDPLIETWPSPSKSGETLLVRRDGDAILFLNDLRRNKDAAMTLRLPLTDSRLPAQRAVWGEETIMEGIDYSGVPVLAATRTIPNSPWALVAKVDLTEIYAPLEQSGQTVALAIGALIAAAGAAFVVVWRQQRIFFYRKQYVAEREQRLLAERYEILTRHANDILLLATPDGQIVDANKRAEESYGYTRAELLWLNARDLCVPDPTISFEERNRLIEKRGALIFETIHVRKDGSQFPVEASANMVHVDGSKFIQIIIRDITVRKQAEAAIRQLNAELETRVQQRTAQLESTIKELESFSYSISHDLRAPLRSIDGFSRILADEFSADLAPDALRYLGIIRRNAQHMGRLIDDLLAFARLNRQPMTKSLVNMRQLVDQALEILQHDCRDRQIKITVGGLPNCEGDAALLRQVWINLISNALKYTRTRDVAKIEIGTMLPSPHDSKSIIYFVKDNGTGFDMQYANKLFGVFQRLHRAEDYEGTGVGLAIAHRILDRHGGDVWAEAQVDQGATFYFTVGGMVAERNKESVLSET